MAILGTGRPLTIACHMKNLNYFLAAVSIFLAAVSILAAAVSIFLAAVSAILAVESTLAESVFASVLEELLQAANAPMANTKNNFFICDLFDVN
jgi:siderophore synthetase component